MKGLLLTYAVAAIGSLWSLRRPKVGLYVYVAFAVLRPQFIWGWAGDMDKISFIVGVALLAGWAFNGFGSWRIGRGRPAVIALLAFAVWSGASGLQAQDGTRAFGSMLELAKIVLPFLVGMTMLEGEKDWRAMLWTIVLAEGYVGLEMNVNYLFKGINTAGQGFGGMDNNCFAVSLVTILGLAVVLGISSRKWYQRGLAAACAALILHTTLLTYSRGALIGLLAVGGVAVAIVPKRPRYMLPILIVAAVAWRFTGPELAARYQSAFVASDVLDSSAESRLDLWRDCLTVIEQSPVFGVGPANWQVVASNYGWPAGKSAHSVWMETAAETGIPGVLALLLFFGTAIVRLWPIARGRVGMANKPDQVLAIGLILSVVGFAVSGQFVTVTGLEAPYYVVMIAVVLLKLQRPEPATVVMSIAQAVMPLPSAPGPTVTRLPRRSPATRISPSTTASR